MAGVLAAPAAAAGELQVKVLSNRADVISAGDALVEVKLPAGVSPSAVTVKRDGTNITNQFALRPNGRFQGLVDRPEIGDQRAHGDRRQRRAARVTITNHPNGGPVFSGPQIQPWVCQSTAVDAQCNQPATVEWLYMPADGGGLTAYDPENPPSDVGTTTTDEGKTVPFIVRHETGYQDRDQYQIAILYDPSKPFEPWAPQDGWNHKLLITHGASCGIERQAGSAPDVLNEAALGRGMAVMSTALNNSGHNCNLVTQAESMVMAKEHLVEQFGDIRYTIGTGCSGGALAQQQIANAYPGIYQGILPACSFPDAWSTGQQLAAYNLLRSYHEDPTKWAPGVAGTRSSIGLVEGHPNHVNSIVFDTIYWTDLGVPDDGCAGVPAEQTYNAETNPGGVRCTLADYMINVSRPARAERVGPAGAGARPRLRRPAARQRRRAVRARPAREGPDHAGAVRRPQREDRRPVDRHPADRGALRGVAGRAAQRLPQRRRQLDQQHGRARRDRPARARPGRVPRRLPLVGDPRADGARAGRVPEEPRRSGSAPWR